MSFKEQRMPIDPHYMPTIIGRMNENIDLIADRLAVKIYFRGNELIFQGAGVAVDRAATIVEILYRQIATGQRITVKDLSHLLKLAKEDQLTKVTSFFEEVLAITYQGKKIHPKTSGQQEYFASLKKNVLTFGIGPAGTGKTYLAIAAAVAALQAKQVKRLILSRPAVEAGEKLGFLPGDLQEKVDPYLRPLYDALYEIIGVELFQKYQEKGIIEIAPLAYMRGRTLDNAFIILDEAQNTTPEQMKMFLTRMGFGSKMVVVGDITQVDLARGVRSGLAQVDLIFKEIEGIGIVYLQESDVVRHELVQQIIKAYQHYQHSEEGGEAGSQR